MISSLRRITVSLLFLSLVVVIGSAVVSYISVCSNRTDCVASVFLFDASIAPNTFSSTPNVPDPTATAFLTGQTFFTGMYVLVAAATILAVLEYIEPHYTKRRRKGRRLAKA